MSILRGLAASAAVASVAAAGAGLRQFSTCGWNSLGSSFDLSPMHRNAAQQTYILPDVRLITSTYYFNFCDQVAVPDALCTSGGRNGNYASATGWQVERPTQGSATCYRLGDSMAAGWNFSFYDVNYPNRGVVLTYNGGESVWCPTQNGVQRNRTLSLELTCDPSADPTTYASGVTVREENVCDYRVQLPSLAGCPLECQTGGNLCNGHGVCGFNTDAGRSQCFCYSGWADAKCGTQTKSDGLSTEGILLIIVCLTLVAVIALVGFMFVRLRKLQVDPAAYDNLQGRFNELGQLT